MKELLKKIQDKEIIVGIIGLGYVGLPLVINFSKNNIKVIGFDIDKNKVELLNNKKSYIKYISDKVIEEISNNFKATDDFSLLNQVDFIIICVPTPLDKYRNPDMTYVFNTARTISKYLRRNQVVILESTTYPLTTEVDLKNILEESGLVAGVDFYLGFSPEREDPGNKQFTFKQVPKIVSGINKESLILISKLYSLVVDKVVEVSSPKVAEAAKLLENIYRSVNIALVNELKIIFDRMGIDIWEVIEAAKTKPFGFQAFYPGPGLGGHCIPIDPFYLTWKAKEYDVNTKFIELAGEINTYMPYYVIQKTIEVLNKFNKSIFGCNVLVLGLAYKKDVDDARESPALKIIDILENDYNCKVDYNDPYIPKSPKFRKYNILKESVELTQENLRKYDVVIVVTDHSLYDPEFIAKNSNLVIDTRNLIKNHYPNVFKA
ncbi:MAG: nucleotide sugar dehydrogenase [bacterium]|jgi:UDP-N-acetyl-D-glucosamine dehydrogenase